MDQMIAINKIYNEDCLNGMQKIDDKSIDLICTDLPYGQTARNKWDSVIPFEPLWEQYERIIKDNGAIILFGNGMFTADLMQSNRKLWRYNIIWEKTQPSGHLNANKMPLRTHEDICVFYKEMPPRVYEDICVFYKKLPTYHPQKTGGHPRKVKQNINVIAKNQRITENIILYLMIVQSGILHPSGSFQRIHKNPRYIQRKSPWHSLKKSSKRIQILVI